MKMMTVMKKRTKMTKITKVTNRTKMTEIMVDDNINRDKFMSHIIDN